MDISKFRTVADTLFREARALSTTDIGVTREAYGAGESALVEYLSDFAQKNGLVVAPDRAANLHFYAPETDPAATSLWCGSHLDSVPQGGNYDGLAGIVAGLLCLLAQKAARETKKSPNSDATSPMPFRVLGFRGEESAWFGKTYVGSSALLGQLSAEDLALTHRDSAKTLGEGLLSVGADVQAIAQQETLVDKSAIHAYLELHIEQGPVMVARELPLAVVSGIRGNVRHNRIHCFGEAGHSGAVPRWLRRDAMFAVADLLMRLDEHWRTLLERGTDLVLTTGMLSTDAQEHSITRIPGKVSFSLDIRSRSDDTLEAFYQLMRAECKAVSRERHVHFEFDRRVKSAPAIMDEKIRSAFSAACTQRAIPFESIASGAGHDASIFANAGIPSGMIFVRNRNGSHNPLEAMDSDDFMHGAQVLYDTLTTLSTRT